jgi:TRAP-type C4-dicarboxylate transport system substrate-binding protein
MATLAPSVALAQPGSGGEDPLTLRLAVADDVDRPSDPYVRAFVDEVATRSDGTLTIEPVFDAGRDTEQGFEQGVAHLLVDGAYELALSAGRAWHDAGVTSLLALQAPFLIADDELAVAVARSQVADDLLTGMADHGVVGLALWPEDLRHPVAFEPCIGPLVSPEQFDGLTVRAIPSAITTDVIEALGAAHTWVDGYEALVERCEIQAAESGLRQGASLPGRPTFTANVTFFPKYQVLAANGDAFDGLSAERQALLREAAQAVRDQALDEHPSDAEAAAEWCASGGRVVLAGPDAVAAFEEAVQPVYDQLAADPVVADAIADIQSLKASMEATSTIEPCGAQSETSAPEASAGAVAVVPDGISTGEPGLPAPGVYRRQATLEELSEFVSPERAQEFVGPITPTFDGERWAFGTCGGPYALIADSFVRLTYELDPGTCGTAPLDLLWTNAGADSAQSTTGPGANEIDQAIFTGRWARIGEAP